MTPYLVGLLVLLGMLGTFLGMVVTLNGAVMALESTTDLPTIRAALAAPVKGLGLAFGTSVAGVAASAMLGLVSALCRRERLQAAQALDARIATSLRPFSLAHQREQTLESLAGAGAGDARGGREDAGHDGADGAAQRSAGRAPARRPGALLPACPGRLCRSGVVGRPLAEGQPGRKLPGWPVRRYSRRSKATMAGITRETARFQEQLAGTVRSSSTAWPPRFDTTVTAVADGWTGALDRHERSSEALASGSAAIAGGFTETFDATRGIAAGSGGRAAAGVAERHAPGHGRTWRSRRARCTRRWPRRPAPARWRGRAVRRHGHHRGAALARRAGRAAAEQPEPVRRLQTSLAALVAGFARQSTALLATLAQAHAALQSNLARGDEARLAAWTGSLEAMAQSLQDQWQQVGDGRWRSSSRSARRWSRPRATCRRRPRSRRATRSARWRG